MNVSFSAIVLMSASPAPAISWQFMSNRMSLLHSEPASTTAGSPSVVVPVSPSSK